MKRILDIGCNDGSELFYQALKNRENRYVGCDIIEMPVINVNSSQGAYRYLCGVLLRRAHTDQYHPSLTTLKAAKILRLGQIKKKEWGNIIYEVQNDPQEKLRRYVEILLRPPQDSQKHYTTYEQGARKVVKAMSKIPEGRSMLGNSVQHLLRRIPALWKGILSQFSEIRQATLEDILCSPSPTETNDILKPYTERITLIEADGRVLPFQDNCFDYVMANHVPIMKNFNGFLKEVHRVTKKGGKIKINWVPEKLRKKYPEGIKDTK
jgi:SAM-dependent methyltransferase